MCEGVSVSPSRAVCSRVVHKRCHGSVLTECPGTKVENDEVRVHCMLRNHCKSKRVNFTPVGMKSHCAVYALPR